MRLSLPSDDRISSQRLANFFDVSRQTIHEWVRHKGLPHHRTVGRQLRFDPLAVRAYCERRSIAVPDALLRLLARLDAHRSPGIKRSVLIHEELPEAENF